MGLWLSGSVLCLLLHPWTPSAAMVRAGATTSLFQRGGPMGGLRERDLLRENVRQLATTVRRTSAVIQGALARGTNSHDEKVYVTAYGVRPSNPSARSVIHAVSAWD